MLKFFRRKFYVFALLTLLALTSGCNFFGRQKDEAVMPVVGMLSNGDSVLGTWSLSSASPITGGNPDDAYTESYTFDPTGNAQIRLRDPHKSGYDCVAYGEYRVVAQSVTIYVRGLSSNNCPFGSQLTLYNIRIGNGGAYLRASDSTGAADYRFLAQRSPINALIGLWSFGGAGGFDFVWFDEYGYFLMQVSEAGQQYLLMGYYDALVSGALQMQFFTDFSFDHVSNTPLVFSSYLTDGTNLQLTFTDANGEEDYVGTRL